MTMIIILVFMLILMFVLGILFLRQKSSRNESKKTVKLSNMDSQQALKAKSDNSEQKLIDQFDADVDLSVNNKYLGDNIESKDKTIELVKNIGIDLGISIGADVAIALSKKGIKVLVKKAVKTALVQAIKKIIPKLAIKAGATALKSVAKLANPIAWGLAYFDFVSAIWDITDVGKLSTYREAKDWIELRDIYKKEFDKASNNQQVVIGPLSKIQKDDVNKFIKMFEEETTAQVTIWADKVINEITNIADKTPEEISTILVDNITENQSTINNMVFKSLCQRNQGKYLGKDLCTYIDKDSCDKNYSWPIKEGEIYTQWEDGKCIQSWGGHIRELCEKQGIANIGYDYTNKTCIIKEPYCNQYGYSYKAQDSEVDNFPNCYKTTGRKVADVVVGETITKDLEDLFSKEKNCGDRCSSDQYCYTVTGRGGICLAKAEPGETCPVGMNDSCYGDSNCNLSSEGYLAAIGVGAAGVATGGAALGLAGLVAAGGAGRSIQANLGMCTAGADGEKRSSSTNSGHYIKNGLKGCSAAWKCPPKVSKDGKIVKYHCENVFTPCKAPKNDGQFCLLGQHDWCKEGSHCGADSKCAKKGAPGKGCFVGEACTSGICKGAVCANPDGTLPRGSTCALARGDCSTGDFCGLDLKCQPKLSAGSACLSDSVCANGDCSGGVCLNSSGKVPAGAVCALDRGNCQDGYFCALDLTCSPKIGSGGACLTDGACASGKCAGAVCQKKIGNSYYTPTGSNCALSRGSCEPGSFCAANGFCKAKFSKGSGCLTDSACASDSCSWLTCN